MVALIVDGMDFKENPLTAIVCEWLLMKHWSKSLKILIAEDNNVSIDCSIMVAYGNSVVNVAAAVQQSVTASVESMTGVKVNVVNVNICGIIRK